MAAEREAVGYSEMAALVAGGTSGTGLAVAALLVERGVRRLALLGRNLERGRHAAASLARQTSDLQAHFVTADAADPDQVGFAVGAAAERLGGLDAVVSAVAPAVLPRPSSGYLRTDIAPHLLEVSLPPLLLTHAASEVMRTARGGSIVLVASDAARVPTPGEGVIGAGMAAIGMYARVSAVEGGRFGIRVNTVTPSLIQGTPTTKVLMNDDFSRRLFEKALTRAPLGPTAVDDVARLVVFLAGPDSARITGQMLSVNGGLSI